MSNLPLIVFFFVVFLSNLTEAVAGFGSVILAITLGAYLFPVQQLIPILVPLNILLGVVLLAKHSGHINHRLLFMRILPLTAIGMPIGIYFFNSAPNEIVKPVFGFMVLAVAAYELWGIFRTSPAPSPLKPWKAWLFLFSGGVMQGLYASGGPFVVYYSVREMPNKGEMRSTLAALWLILNGMLVVALFNSGKFTVESLKITGLFVPAVLAGFFVGEKLHHRVSEKTFRGCIYALLVLAGMGLIVKPN